jgi:hypothetical protein
MVTSPARAKKQSAEPAKASKKSPKKREITSINLSEADMNGKRKLDYHLKIVKLACDFELIYIKDTPGNDGFGQKLFDHITNNNGFCNEGVLVVAKRRVSQADNSVLANANNLFPGVSLFGQSVKRGPRMRTAFLSCVRFRISSFEPTTTNLGMLTLLIRNPT